MGTWQTAIITYSEQEDAMILEETWSIPFEKEQVRILPYIDHNKCSKERARYVVKLAGIPRGTTAYDLEEARKDLGAKTVYIPRTPGYYRERYAYMALDTRERYLAALEKTYIIGKQEAKVVTQDSAVCFKCGGPSHWARDCGEVKIIRIKKEADNKFASLQRRFKEKHEGNVIKYVFDPKYPSGKAF